MGMNIKQIQSPNNLVCGNLNNNMLQAGYLALARIFVCFYVINLCWTFCFYKIGLCLVFSFSILCLFLAFCSYLPNKIT